MTDVADGVDRSSSGGRGWKARADAPPPPLDETEEDEASSERTAQDAAPAAQPRAEPAAPAQAPLDQAPFDQTPFDQTRPDPPLSDPDSVAFEGPANRPSPEPEVEPAPAPKPRRERLLARAARARSARADKRTARAAELREARRRARAGANGDDGDDEPPARNPSRLTRRIVSFNLIGLGLLVAGVLALNDFRGKLIELRTQALETQGEIIAITLAESAGRDDGALGIDPPKAQVVLARVIEPARVRAQIFDRGARLMVDTHLAAGQTGGVQMENLPASRFDRYDAPDGPMAWIEGAGRFLRDFALGDTRKPVATEILGGVARMQEVYAALGGAVARGERVNARGELIVSVSVPIQTLRKVHGALVLSTEGGDIDAIVRSERVSILQVFLVALAVSVVLSVLLAKAIGRPIERLAEAALAAERGQRGKTRVELPDMTARGDEIGHLSGALKRMTDTLYQRLEATESFAADVAHEIKNPLSSLRSAVETLGYARTEADKLRLMKVMNHDVARLDRLVTDISNASRLDAELVREEREPFDLSNLLTMIVEFTQPKAQERAVRIRDEAVDDKLRMRGIEGRLAQVFVNLIENALSFSPEGSEIRVAAARGGDGRIRVTVEDEGPGIPDENLESVFERFYSQRPDTEAYGNHSGLGLAISRQIVEAHNGSIAAENIRPAGHDRRGARFVVELPG
ncbi:stimulus-sensing domain-containing protein [Albimonas sp. CAU 1670]|uniref:sensor histidine kinase n=1 Tax=Albimonas sp. CAU 1670 TaxID=3032599 RepID=UPI0023D987B9|nr:stimulus-sensing domain-containing protein [Albimonas sp. CAU 1670]MDF2233879.1 stimulus-sensing domain-containing protein [Albimonas sp. CAU 1670]